MAIYESLVPFILSRETGCIPSPSDTPRQVYEKAAQRGVTTVRGDRGGATMCGVTLHTLAEWHRRQEMPRPTLDDLASLDYDQWYALTKTLIWDRCRADEITRQNVADMLADWQFTSGAHATRNAQRALGLTPDGIVGPLTLAALNDEAAEVFATLKAARIAYYRRIARGPQARFLRGWLNRVNALDELVRS